MHTHTQTCARTDLLALQIPSLQKRIRLCLPIIKVFMRVTPQSSHCQSAQNKESSPRPGALDNQALSLGPPPTVHKHITNVGRREVSTPLVKSVPWHCQCGGIWLPASTCFSWQLSHLPPWGRLSPLMLQSLISLDLRFTTAGYMGLCNIKTVPVSSKINIQASQV